jgi:hypothetical protein
MTFRSKAPLVAALCAALAGPALADAVGDSPPVLASVPALSATPEAQLRGELRGVLVRMLESGAFGETAPQDIHLLLALPAQHVVDLGLVLDTRGSADEGLRVLGTSPGGAAQALGVRTGDVLTAVDGAALAGLGRAADGSAAAIAVLRVHMDGLADGGTLRLDAVRDGQPVQLAGAVAARYLPALRLELGEGAMVASNAPVALATSVGAAAPAQSGDTCGRISTFHVAPRSQDMYAARVLKIDGSIPGAVTQETYRVAPGKHTLEVAERIDSNDLSTTFNRARRHRTKTIEVDVAPGATLLVAAHLNKDQQYSFGDAGFWDPVVWKTISESCD